MKVVNLKQAILQAWKERWSDYQWAINIKRNCPKGVTWDYLNLAGQCRNTLLFLTYVKRGGFKVLHLQFKNLLQHTAFMAKLLF